MIGKKLPNGNVLLEQEFSEEDFARMNRLIQKCGLQDVKDLFNTAFTLLSTSAQEWGKGRDVASVDEQTKKYWALPNPLGTQSDASP